MTNPTPQEQVSQMFNEISPTYDRVNRILSFGLDRLWRKRLTSLLPSGNSLTLIDLATGTGDQLLSLMKSGKISSALGIDLAEEMLSFFKTKVAGRPFANEIALEVASALDIPAEEGSFDCATISFGIRNVGDPGLCLREMHRVLKPGGRALILEFSLPKIKLVRFFHLLYLRKVLPFLGGVISGKPSAYSYLNKTIEAFPYGSAFCNLMKEANFSNVHAHPMTLGVATLYMGEKQ
ncbi:MAG: Demethylmenaquinone methyltransferase [Chlamydiae bacterium]|nr:Demethylmenaquinone methyltransferase [Chlamydiota bacterium]